MVDVRIALIRDWLSGELGWPRDMRLEPASADASFRRYFRVWRASGSTAVVMDAPPDKEDTAPYLQVSRLLRRLRRACARRSRRPIPRAASCCLRTSAAPTCSRARAPVASLTCCTARHWPALALIQTARCGRPVGELRPYDAQALDREMQLLPAWFCARHLRLTLEPRGHRPRLRRPSNFLIRELLAQPVVFVHRDYHSRNLMITAERSPGVIDFQDALAGPIGYDLVSLLKDCYICWPTSARHRMARRTIGGDCRRRAPT